MGWVGTPDRRTAADAGGGAHGETMMYTPSLVGLLAVTIFDVGHPPGSYPPTGGGTGFIPLVGSVLSLILRLGGVVLDVAYGISWGGPAKSRNSYPAVNRDPCFVTT